MSENFFCGYIYIYIYIQFGDLFLISLVLAGLLLAASSIVFGIETARGFKWLWNRRPKTTMSKSPYIWNLNKCKSNLIVTTALVLILCGVWAVCIAREATEFNKANNKNAQLLFACIVGPFGVWTRWYLARLNGRGIGERGILKWVPFGTLAANVLASCLMAALAILKKAVKSFLFFCLSLDSFVLFIYTIEFLFCMCGNR